MNIKQIISEAIDNAILMQGYREIESALGNGVIDTTPVGANGAAVNYINQLSDFAWQVRYAIDSKHFRPSTGTRRPTTRQTTLNAKQQENPRRQKGNLIDKFVNNTADLANNMYGNARNAGLDGLDPVVGGMVTTFQNGYNLGRDKWLGKLDGQQQQPQQQQPVRRRPIPRKTGIDLTTLMGQQYRTILYNYNYVNQLSSNILSRVQGVRKVLSGLEKIKNALSKP